MDLYYSKVFYSYYISIKFVGIGMELFQWTRVFEPPPDINSLDFKKLYWNGYNDFYNNLSGTLCTVMDIFKYAVWKSKQRRHLPNILALSREISFILAVACTVSRTFRLTTANFNLISNLFQAPG